MFSFQMRSLLVNRVSSLKTYELTMKHKLRRTAVTQTLVFLQSFKLERESVENDLQLGNARTSHTLLTPDVAPRSAHISPHCRRHF